MELWRVSIYSDLAGVGGVLTTWISGLYLSIGVTTSI